MPKPTEIVDFLLERVDGLKRGELEARLKALRRAGLWPAARRVGKKKADRPTARHCANLLMGLLSVNAADAAEAVRGLADLPYSSKSIKGNASIMTTGDKETDATFGDFLEIAISKWTAGIRPWTARVDIREIAGLHGSGWAALVNFVDLQEDKPDDPFIYILEFARADAKSPTKIHMGEARIVHGYIIGHFVDFLKSGEGA